jgi:hypothetical protein
MAGSFGIGLAEIYNLKIFQFIVMSIFMTIKARRLTVV